MAPQRILYSNLGYALLGLALAEATGTPYEQLARQRVLEPLGMCASGFHTPLLVNGRDRFTLPVGPWQMAAFTPAGGLRSNVTDLLRLAVALLPGIDSPLSAAAALASRPRGELRAGVRTGLGVMLGPGQLVWHNAGTAGFWCWLGAAAHTGTAVVAAATGPPRRELDTAASALIPTR